MYTLRERILPEDELKIFDETLEIRLEATNQQLKKWLILWRPVINHSMKKVKEMAQTRSIGGIIIRLLNCKDKSN